MYDVTVHASKTSHSRVRSWLLLLTVWPIAPGSGQSACLDTCCALQQEHMACAGLASRCIKCTDAWGAFAAASPRAYQVLGFSVQPITKVLQIILKVQRQHASCSAR